MSQAKFGAVRAKIMSMYGLRLRSEDYDALSNMHSAPDIAKYLKRSPAYAGLLRNVDDKLLHRSQLEDILSGELASKSYRLFRFIGDDSQKLPEIFVLKNEIDALLSYMRHIIAKRPELYFFPADDFFSRSALPIAELKRCATIPELCAALKGHPLGAVLAPFANSCDYTAIESALLGYYFEFAARASGRFDKKTAGQFGRFFAAEADFKNLARIVRVKLYYKDCNPADYLLPYGRLLGKKQASAAAGLEIRALAERYKNTYLAYCFDSGGRYSDDGAKRYFYTLCRRILRRPDSGAMTIVAFLKLKELEISNITGVIEGVRYGLSPAEIRTRIIRKEM